MITVKVLRCKSCQSVLAEYWTADKQKENWYCEECGTVEQAKKDAE